MRRVETPKVRFATVCSVRSVSILDVLAFVVPGVLVASESALPRRRLVHETTPSLRAASSSSRNAERRCHDASVVLVPRVRKGLQEDEDPSNVPLPTPAVLLQMLQLEVMSTQAACLSLLEQTVMVRLGDVRSVPDAPFQMHGPLPDTRSIMCDTALLGVRSRG